MRRRYAMHIVKIGISHQIASLEIREKLSFSEQLVKQAMLELQRYDGIAENIIISTCNRTEIYVVSDNKNAAVLSIEQFLSNWFQLSVNDIALLFSQLTDDEAINHLFKLAIGLDSMVIGETQILGQVRNAFLTAQQLKVSRRIFNELFKRVITFAKKVHRDTDIGRRAVSISYAAVELSKKVFGDLRSKHIIVLGAGKTGELTLKNLNDKDGLRITLISRTFEQAEKLANKYSREAAPIEDLPRFLTEADIIISSTTSTTFVFTKETLKNSLGNRKGNPLLLIDLAVPRDIDYRVNELDGVFLYNIDDLQRVIDENIQARKKIAHSLQQQLEAERRSFEQWLNELPSIPVIQALQEKAVGIQMTVLESIHRKIPDLSDREVKVLQKHTKSIIHQLLQQPINHLKSLGSEEDQLENIRLMFGLNDERND